ncbi:ABC transporter permease subunit [Actinoplanes sp. NPDC023714]|uniref:ABC transporter permease subunit n=1 Tax=Actinoplanes sp. NPDC023714 TaxID=3154322 RepID=UPI0033CFC0BE
MAEIASAAPRRVVTRPRLRGAALLGTVPFFAYALVTTRPDGVLRRVVTAAAGVLAQFGGVTLAFAFLATIGLSGFLTLWLSEHGVDLYAGGVWLFELPGLTLVYTYFQIPLTVIVFLPALDGIRPQWREAAESLGGTTWQYWTRVAGPLLAPAFLGSTLLLFANAFSAYATAAALVSQGSPIVPLQIRGALTSEVVLGQANLGKAMALGMVIVVAVVMTLYSLLQRRTARWLAAMVEFSTRDATTWPLLVNWPELSSTYPGLANGIVASLLQAALTSVLMLVLLVPTAIWVRLRLPRLRPLVEFLCLLPLTIPAIVLVVGLAPVYAWVNYFLGGSSLTLVFAYTILVLPYAYRAIDAGLSAIDVKTLAEAARSLGAGWTTVIWRVVLPNIRSAVLSAAFLTVALVLGEFTIASLLHRTNLRVAIDYLGKSSATMSVAVSLAALLLAFVLLIVLSLIGDRRSPFGDRR